MPGLNGKVAIVTGGARGIGAATSRKLVKNGARVIVADVLDDEGRALVHELHEQGAHVGFMRLDVSDETQWQEAVAGAVKNFGGLHILVNNAGIASEADVETETLAGFNKVVAINQTGVWLGMKYGAPAIRHSGGGAIVNVSSVYGAVGGTGTSIAYHAAKGAVRLMTKNAAIRYAREGIRVNSVHPGCIDTPMIERYLKGTDALAREYQALTLASTPLGRAGQPEEVASAIVFLASDEASFMTGSEVYVDGGLTAQ